LDSQKNHKEQFHKLEQLKIDKQTGENDYFRSILK